MRLADTVACRFLSCTDPVRMTEHASCPNLTDDIRWSFDLRYQPTGQPTGREVLPGFVARSSAEPETVLDDPAAWAELWWAARDRMAGGAVDLTIGLRWSEFSDHPVCA